jgi:hypothetical protein
LQLKGYAKGLRSHVVAPKDILELQVIAETWL